MVAWHEPSRRGATRQCGQPIAQIYSIEKAEIVVPVPDEDLAWFTLPTPIDTRMDTWDAQRIDDNRREDPNASFHYARGATTRVQGTLPGGNTNGMDAGAHQGERIHSRRSAW